MGMYEIRSDGTEKPYECEGDLDSALLEVRKLWAAGHDVVYVESPLVMLICDRRESGTRVIAGLFKS